MKRLLRLFVAIVVVVLLFRVCSSNMGSVINLPGSTSETSTEDSGGWFSPKKESTETSSNVNKSIKEDASDLEKELGIGTEGSTKTSTNIPTTTTKTTTTTSTTTADSSSPLTFKGIPISGTLSSFGNELVNAGFKKSSNGTYTGDFAGYSGCKVTPSGTNPVKEVRVDFPVISDWDALEKAYDSLQASLTQKYGIEPETSVGSNVATYNLPNGTITLDADVKSQSTWHVILKYANSQTISIPSTSANNPIDDL